MHVHRRSGKKRQDQGKADKVVDDSAKKRNIEMAIVEEDLAPGIDGIIDLSFQERFKLTVDGEAGLPILDRQSVIIRICSPMQQTGHSRNFSVQETNLSAGKIMRPKIEKKRLAILRILQQSNAPVGSKAIREHLLAMGYDISERTVRFHLLAMDESLLTENIGRKGRIITEFGRSELAKARVFDKVGFLTAKIDRMTYEMSFDLESLEGTVVVNISLLEIKDLKESVPLMERVYGAGFAMGEMIGFFEPGEQVGDLYIPKGWVGIGTVCSITLNGAMLARGIPTNTRFGGLLEIEDGKPSRFVAIINYDGTTIDPLEIFIKSKMTDYLGATSTGNGQIGASFREVPAAARERVIELQNELSKVGLGGFLEIGMPGQALRDIPINEGHVGAIVIAGLNPVAILVESGIEVHSRALAGLIDYRKLFHYSALGRKTAHLM